MTGFTQSIGAAGKFCSTFNRAARMTVLFGGDRPAELLLFDQIARAEEATPAKRDRAAAGGQAKIDMARPAFVYTAASCGG